MKTTASGTGGLCGETAPQGRKHEVSMTLEQHPGPINGEAAMHPVPCRQTHSQQALIMGSGSITLFTKRAANALNGDVRAHRR